MCTNEKECVNCKKQNLEPTNHSNIDRRCPEYIKQKEITAIKVIQKTDHKTATKLYQERNNKTQSYATTVKSSTPETPNSSKTIIKTHTTTIQNPHKTNGNETATTSKPSTSHAHNNTTNTYLLTQNNTNKRPLTTYDDVVEIDSDTPLSQLTGNNKSKHEKPAKRKTNKQPESNTPHTCRNITHMET